MSRTRSDILVLAREAGAAWAKAPEWVKNAARRNPELYNALEALTDVTERTTPRED